MDRIEQATWTATVEDTRRTAAAALDQERRGELGQFFTPAPVAVLMAGMFYAVPERVRLLDAGAGSGALTGALIAELCQRQRRPSRIEATAFELDAVLLPHLRRTLDGCAAQCRKSGIACSTSLRAEDFIDAAVRSLDGGWLGDATLRFEAAILNPPYRKIGAASRERRLLRSVGLDATNLYAAFVALAVRLLVPGGQLVAIIPRSFCNGPYFRAFRALLLDATALRRIHVFTSRDRAFGEDGVLQENVIIHAVAGPPDGAQILVSSSAHAEAPCRRRTLPAETVIRSAAGDRFLHLPVGVDDGADSSWMAGLPCTLADLGLTVSTGRVVDFRARAHLRPQAGPGLLPLIYPCHFAQGRIAWPRPQARKPNALARHDDTEALLVPSGFYTVTKRFSSKEERRRLVAAVYDPDLVSAAPVGFENHLNYFHEQGHGLDPDLAYGLMVFLNATPIDRYFRQFNGHTQVNATDLRSLRYPARKDLTAWGRWWRRGSCGLDQAAIDAQVMARTA